MLTYPQIDPVAFHLGFIPVHWYGLMYLVGFLGGWAVLALRIRMAPRALTQEELSDLLFYLAVGTIIGGRLGYMVFYDWQNMLIEPWRIFQIWKGGMSFHGGCIGVAIAGWIFSRQHQKSFGDMMDFIVPAVPIGLGAGRIGNFINGELWGRTTTTSWGMIFPSAGDLPRHPSQLYEFFLEGVLLFAILWIFSMQPRPRYAVSGLFFLCYGVFRFVVEYFREPDAQIGFVAFDWVTKGQILSVPMIILGAVLMILAYRRKKSCNSI